VHGVAPRFFVPETTLAPLLVALALYVVCADRVRDLEGKPR